MHDTDSDTCDSDLASQHAHSSTHSSTHGSTHGSVHESSRNSSFSSHGHVSFTGNEHLPRSSERVVTTHKGTTHSNNHGLEHRTEGNAQAPSSTVQQTHIPIHTEAGDHNTPPVTIETVNQQHRTGPAVNYELDTRHQSSGGVHHLGTPNCIGGGLDTGQVSDNDLDNDSDLSDTDSEGEWTGETTMLTRV